MPMANDWRVIEKCPLYETAYGAPQIDAEAGVLRGVKVLGRSSSNDREYSDNALAQAARLYEGAEVNIDHPVNPESRRGFAEGFGVLRNAAVKSDGVYADLHYLKSHPLAEQVLERAGRMPEKFGLSHNAEGRVKRVNGKWIVESLERVRSVDLVRNPATCKTLFESEGNAMVKTNVRAVLAADKVFCRLLEQMPEEMADAPVEMPSDASSDDQIKAAFRSAVMAAFDDDSLDRKATLKKIGDILKAYEKLSAAPAESGGSSDASAETTESVAEKARGALASALLEAAGIKPTEGKTAALAALVDPADMTRHAKGRQELIEAWREKPVQPAAKQRPTSSRSIMEQGSGSASDKYPADVKSLVAGWR